MNPRLLRFLLLLLLIVAAFSSPWWLGGAAAGVPSLDTGQLAEAAGDQAPSTPHQQVSGCAPGGCSPAPSTAAWGRRSGLLTWELPAGALEPLLAALSGMRENVDELLKDLTNGKTTA